jgi:hypothetical protein
MLVAVLQCAELAPLFLHSATNAGRSLSLRLATCVWQSPTLLQKVETISLHFAIAVASPDAEQLAASADKRHKAM